MLKHLRNENQLHGIHLSKELEPQTHQQFVDGTMLMGPSTIQEAQGLKKGLDTFLEASGIEINKDKSQVYFFNTPKVTRRNILRILEFLESVLPSKYLGAPLADSTIRQICWKELLDKIKKNIRKWTSRALNLPSRLNLVK